MRKLAWFAVFFAAAALVILLFQERARIILWPIPLAALAAFGLSFLKRSAERPIVRILRAALLGFGLRMDCFGFWMGDALAGFMPLLIGGVFYLSGRWRSRERVEA